MTKLLPKVWGLVFLEHGVVNELTNERTNKQDGSQYLPAEVTVMFMSHTLMSVIIRLTVITVKG